MLHRGKILNSVLIKKFDQSYCRVCFSSCEPTAKLRSSNCKSSNSTFNISYTTHPIRRASHILCFTLNTRQNDSEQNERWWYKSSILIGLASATLGLILLGRNSVSASEKQTINKKRLSLLLNACKDNDLEGIRKLLKDGADVDGKHRLGWTPLMVAAINNNYTAVKLLLQAKANPNIPDSYSNAVKMSQETGIPRQQLQQIRDSEFSNILSAKDFRGSTALHYASLADNSEMIAALIQAGADPMIRNAQGFKPSQFGDPRKYEQFKHWEEEFEVRRKELEAEMRRRFPLEKRLQERIIGQEGAINVVASAMRRKENGWFDDDHPLVMLFLGSSGIGKTELAKQLASYLHGTQKGAFIRIDMSEYQSKHEAAKFIGAPPGYVGHEEGGQLTEQLTKFPSAVVLFDEVDKAHPDVLATLLQLFDEGHITDGKGKKVNCKNAVFIMTANVANEEISQHAIELRRSAKELSEDKEDAAIHKAKLPSGTPELSREFKDTIIHPILKKHFKRDEFLGRINEIVYFLPFTNEELNQLVTRQLNYWASKAESIHKMELTWDQSVVEVLAKGFDLHYGARSIIYEVERQVISKLASAQEKQLITAKDKIHLSIGKSGSLVVQKLTNNGKYVPVTV